MGKLIRDRVPEVALALAQHEGITEEEILNQRAAKNRSHGTFDGRLFSTSYRS
jgi:predicted house-cleaning noncanonical NTP pyrophosphatase (MazG superfamily)